MGLNVTGEQMIFRQDKQGRDGTFPAYSTAVSRKIGDKWISDYYEVVFRGEAEKTVLENKTKIRITDGYLGLREYNGNAISQVIVNAFEYLEGQPYMAEPKGFAALTNEDLPF